MLAHLAGVEVDQVGCGGDLVWIRGACAAGGRGVPAVRWRARRVHSRSERTLADAPVAGRRVSIQLRVRRFWCPAVDCPIRTFVEQVEGLTTRHALARRCCVGCWKRSV